MSILERQIAPNIHEVVELAQTALENLVKGEDIDQDARNILQERRRQFVLNFGGKTGKFTLRDVIVYPHLDEWLDGSPKDRVMILAETANGSEYVWLNVNSEGEANFEVSHIEKL